MPGPFPGMDPYLENPNLWRDVHEGMIAYMREALNAALPASYVARINERLIIVPLGRHIYPDLVALRYPTATPVDKSMSGGGTTTAVAVAADPAIELTMLSDEIHEGFIEIVSVSEQDRVVTTIEVLSPTNKMQGDGREQYLTKQHATLESDVHLIEIDLLRSGEHTVAPPRARIEECVGRWDYLVCLHRGGQKGRRFELWPRSVRRRLPRIAVPLDEGVPDVVLNLQTVFNRNYDAGAYIRQVDYKQDPVPPLEGKDARWMAALLRKKGLRE